MMTTRRQHNHGKHDHDVQRTCLGFCQSCRLKQRRPPLCSMDPLKVIWSSSTRLKSNFIKLFYLQPQPKTAPHLVQNAVFTQTGGGSGNNHHHLRHHHQHHINSSSPSSSNVVLFQRRQSVGRVCRSRSIGKVAESVFLKSPLHVEHWDNFCTFSRVNLFNKKLGAYTIENSFISVGWEPFKPLVPWMGNWQDGRLFSSVICPPNSER